MIKIKWVVFDETENFITYIPLRLYKKTVKRLKRGERVIVNPKKIRIQAKNPEALSKILTAVMEVIDDK